MSDQAQSTETNDSADKQPDGTSENTPLTAETTPDAAPAAELKTGQKSKSFLSVVGERVSSLSVRYKIAGTLVIVLMFAVFALGIVTFSRQKGLLEQEMQKRAQVILQQIANVGKEGLLTKQELPVYATITDVQKSAGVVYAMVLDSDGKVFVHSDLGRKGTVLTEATALRAERATELFFQKTDYNNEPVLDAALPIVIKAKNFKIGVARIGISMKALNQAIQRQMIAFLWVSLSFMAIGLALSFALAKILTKPLDTLSKGMQIVAQGDLGHQIPVRSKDEIGRLTDAFNEMILSLQEKLHMEKFLSNSAVKSIKKQRNVARLTLGGEGKYVTALFSDIRGFTAMSEKMTPQEVVQNINVYLNLQAKVIHHWGGNIDKFVGDEVMAIFEGKGEEINAIRAAVEIQRYCAALNEARSAAGEKQINIGIGLNSGDVVMGNMGSEDHMDYTVIGDTINLAARLCSAAKPGQIVLSNKVAETLSGLATLIKLDPISVKGKEKPIDIYEVDAVKGAARREMRHAMDCAVEYQLAGLTDDKCRASAKNISSCGCLLEVASPIGIGSRLNLNMDLDHLGNVAVEGTVHHTRKEDSRYYVGVHFLDMQDDSRHRIVKWIHQVDSVIT